MSYQDVVWKHLKSGNLYRIETFALRESDLTPLVVYRSRVPGEPGQTFVRPCTEFFDGRFVVEGGVTAIAPATVARAT